MLGSVLNQRTLLRSLSSFCKGVLWWFLTAKSCCSARCPAFSQWEDIPDTALQGPVLTLMLSNVLLSDLEKGVTYDMTKFLTVLIYSGW